ncbi:MAG TPA: hypothetical protein VL401_01300 [Alphaproteobacteria bacterium]|jgi:hypothetical protein|nr:hypothetical protein [Alphaproteobacteria bacterium]
MDIKKIWPYIAGGFLVVIVGVASAWVISKNVMGTGSSSVAPGAKSTSTEAGLLDPNVKYGTAIGILQEGGVSNEGTHHLERDGGPSQTVYLTSSVVDLQSFVGKKVEIWGETLSSKKAGWLMDVAKIKVSN